MDNSKDLSRTENIEEFYTFNKLLKITRSIKDCTSKDVDSMKNLIHRVVSCLVLGMNILVDIHALI